MTGKTNDIWIKVWGCGILFAGLILSLIGGPYATALGIAISGAVVAFGQRTYMVYQISIFLSLFYLCASLAGVYFNSAIVPNQTRQIYFIVTAVFYFLFFLVFLKSDIKKSFNPPLPKTETLLSAEEKKRRISFIRVIAVLLIVEGVVSYSFYDWFKSNGLPAEELGAVILEIAAAAGLVFLRANLGRRLALLICLLALSGLITGNYHGFWAFLYTIILVIFFTFTFVFLLLPKTKAVFK